MIGRTLLHYEIVSALGEGGMGVVYKARDTHLDRLVAIKILSAEAVADSGRKRRFTLEAKAASALNHPGIVTIYDIAEDGEIAFIAMEYVQGKTLSELIGRKGLGLKSALNYAVQAADALAKAHAAGIVHRDLKPSNIMVTDGGLVKILDFGVAKLSTTASADVEDGAEAETRTIAGADLPNTEAGKIVGTVAYMSPEQAEGKNVDARSDIFSFGSVLYEMVTGTRLFQEGTFASTLAAVLTKEPTPPGQIAKDLPRDLERIILRCLRKDPARRVQSMADLAVELDEIKTESGTGISAVQGPARSSRARIRRWLFASAAATLLLVAGRWFLWPKPTALPPMRLLPLTSLPGDERLTTFSPDGTEVAFTWSRAERDNLDIYTKTIGSESQLRLTTDPAEDTAPAWSPDGTRIAFVRRKGDDQAAIYVAAAHLPGSEKWVIDYRLTGLRTGTGAGYLTTISWFPDGKWLAVAEQDRDGLTNGIVAIPIEGGERHNLVWGPTSEAIYHFPAVSPSGASLAYAACKAGEADCVVIRMALVGVEKRGSPQILATGLRSAQGIAWGPGEQSVIVGSTLDGKHLERVPISSGKRERIELAGAGAVYPATPRAADELAFVRDSSGSDIWKFESGGRAEPARFASLSSTLNDGAPQYSPDGKRIVFGSDQSGQSQIYVANADGTDVKAVTEPTGRPQGAPRWSPRGDKIAYDAADEHAVRHIWIVHADGGRPTRLTTSTDQEQENVPSWSQDSKWIYYSTHRPGVQKIYRALISGGVRETVFDNTSQERTGRSITLSASESRDGILYFTSGDDPNHLALLAKTLPDGPVRPILSSVVDGWAWVPTTGGLYYIVLPDPAHPSAKELRFFDFVKLTSSTLRPFECLGLQGLTVSPNGNTVLTSCSSLSSGADLMLIQNYNPDTAEAPTNRWIEALAGAVMVVGVLLVWRFVQGKSESQK